jgi:hypothetical protein
LYKAKADGRDRVVVADNEDAPAGMTVQGGKDEK